MTLSLPAHYSRTLTAVSILVSISCAGLGATAQQTDSAPQPSPAAARPAPLRAGFLVVDGVYNTELMAPYDVFEHTRHHDPRGLGIEVFTVSQDGQEIVTAEGLRIRPDYSFATAPPIDVLVVPSAEGSRGADLDNKPLIDWVTATGNQARYSMSLCWGAFVLAKAGLLDERAGTTFPADYARFAQTFPEVDLRFNVSFVHDRDRLTSQGGARSYEVAMYLVDHLFGQDVAAGVGRGLLIEWPPSPRPAMVAETPTGR